MASWACPSNQRKGVMVGMGHSFELRVDSRV